MVEDLDRARCDRRRLVPDPAVLRSGRRDRQGSDRCRCAVDRLRRRDRVQRLREPHLARRQDTLIGAYADSTLWTITDSRRLARARSSRRSTGRRRPEITFSGIQTLIGGLGEPGDNAIADATAAAWNVTGENVGSVGPLASSPTLTFVGFDRIEASGLGADTLAGPSTGTSWTLLPAGTTLPDGSTLASTGFVVEDVTVTGVSSFTGSGQSGSNGDTVTGPAGGVSTWTVDSSGDVTIVTATSDTYAFSGVATLVSGPSGDTLVGPTGGTGSTWTIDGNGSGDLTLAGGASLSFVTFATLTGGGTDTLDAPGLDGRRHRAAAPSPAHRSAAWGRSRRRRSHLFTYYGAPGRR